MEKRRVHYVLSTHWDREWYQSFQDYRYRLVQLLDKVIDGLEHNRLKGPFTADGQAVIMEDYLEVRPERRALVERLARDGRLVIGPWYALPDEFIVSGESIVRNLELGRRVAASFGAVPSSAGFVCDIFGHNSQLPQILTGFGAQAGFVWRGINHVTSRHLIWEGADGTELPCYKFADVGYCSYCSHVRHAFEHDARDPEQMAEDMVEYLAAESQATEVSPILFFDGGDHQEWDEEAYQTLQTVMATRNDYELVHGSLDAYAQELVSERDQISHRLVGELREPGRTPADVDQQWLIPGVVSSRMNLKQANAECQALLCSWAEPMSALASLADGREYPLGFLNVAWKWLLRNHPHDSICGCSIDVVHEDMKFRFSQCRAIAERLRLEAMQSLAADVTGEIGERELRVTVFNPLPRPIEETVELTVGIPTDWPSFNEFFGFEPKPSFRIYADDVEIPYQRLGQFDGRVRTRVYGPRFPESYQTNDVDVSLPICIPAMGYRTLTIKPGEEGKPTRFPQDTGLATSERSMANEFLTVTILSNGSVSIVDKRTGERYERLLTFEDTADIGDGWYHGVAVNDQTYVSTGSASAIALVQNGPMMTRFRVRTVMRVPASFRFDEMRRDEGLLDMEIDSLVTLRPGVDRVEVTTTLHNVARDHRIRVLMPTGADSDTYWADTPFDVVERPVSLRADNHLYRELEVETKPQQSWCAVYDGQRGLAVVGVGLLESAVRDLDDRPIALTLLRGTRRTVNTNGEPEGQLIGPITLRFAIVPLAKGPDAVALCTLGQQLTAGIDSVQLDSKDQALHGADVELPAQADLLQVTGDLVVTSVRLVGETLEVRAFNPTRDPTQAEIRLGASLCERFGQAALVDLKGDAAGQTFDLAEGACRLDIGPKRIVTVRFS